MAKLAPESRYDARELLLINAVCTHIANAGGYGTQWGAESRRIGSDIAEEDDIESGDLLPVHYKRRTPLHESLTEHGVTGKHCGRQWGTVEYQTIPRLGTSQEGLGGMDAAAGMRRPLWDTLRAVALQDDAAWLLAKPYAQAVLRGCPEAAIDHARRNRIGRVVPVERVGKLVGGRDAYVAHYWRADALLHKWLYRAAVAYRETVPGEVDSLMDWVQTEQCDNDIEVKKKVGGKPNNAWWWKPPPPAPITIYDKFHPDDCEELHRRLAAKLAVRDTAVTGSMASLRISIQFSAPPVKTLFVGHYNSSCVIARSTDSERHQYQASGGKETNWYCAKGYGASRKRRLSLADRRALASTGIYDYPGELLGSWRPRSGKNISRVTCIYNGESISNSPAELPKAA